MILNLNHIYHVLCKKTCFKWRSGLQQNRIGLSQKKYIKELQNHVKIYLLAPEQEFIVYKHVQLSLEQKINQATVNKLKFIFLKKETKYHCKKFATAFVPPYEDLLGFTFPEKYRLVKVKVKAKNIEEAYLQANNNFNLLLGIWNFSFLTKKQIFGTRVNPLAKILPGQLTYSANEKVEIHAVFNYDVSLRGEGWMTTFSDDEWNKVKQKQREIFGRLNVIGKRCPKMKQFIENQIIDFNIAISTLAPELCLVRLWGVFQHIACVSSGANHDVIIERLSSLYENHEDVKYKLKYVKTGRNIISHGESWNNGEISAIDLLVRYFYDILRILLNVGEFLKDKQEWEQYLLCQKDYKNLQNKIIKYGFDKGVYKKNNAVLEIAKEFRENNRKEDLSKSSKDALSAFSISRKRETNE